MSQSSDLPIGSFGEETKIKEVGSRNNSVEAMRNFGYDKCCDCLRIILKFGLNSRIMMRGKWKRVSPRRIRLVGGSKQMNNMTEYGVFIPYYDVVERLTNRRVPRIAMSARIL